MKFPQSRSAYISLECRFLIFTAIKFQGVINQAFKSNLVQKHTRIDICKTLACSLLAVKLADEMKTESEQ
jgi:hypothetical protein